MSNMHSRIGFVILSHNNPSQLLRLTRRLVQLYDGPTIVCHHDFSKCSLAGFDFPKEVTFVNPHINTKWGSILLVTAFREALRTMYQRTGGPDWFVFISGADYPVQSAQVVLADLDNGGFDAYVDHYLVEHPFTPVPGFPYEEHGCKSVGWVPLAYNRYIAVPLWLPWYSRTQRKLIKVYVGHVRAKSYVRLFNPFPEHLKCYGGSGWFTGNRKAAERLLAENDENRALFAYYSNKFIPDESLPHTILCNQPDLKISGNDFRYIDWSAGGHHPKTLTTQDIPRMRASGAHFARKFDLAKGAEVFDALDAVVDS